MLFVMERKDSKKNSHIKYRLQDPKTSTVKIRSKATFFLSEIFCLVIAAHLHLKGFRNISIDFLFYSKIFWYKYDLGLVRQAKMLQYVG